MTAAEAAADINDSITRIRHRVSLNNSCRSIKICQLFSGLTSRVIGVTNGLINIMLQYRTEKACRRNFGQKVADKVKVNESYWDDGKSWEVGALALDRIEFKIGG